MEGESSRYALKCVLQNNGVPNCSEADCQTRDDVAAATYAEFHHCMELFVDSPEPTNQEVPRIGLNLVISTLIGPSVGESKLSSTVCAAS